MYLKCLSDGTESRYKVSVILPKGEKIFRRNMFIVCSFYASNLARSNLSTQAFEQALFQILQLKYF